MLKTLLNSTSNFWLDNVGVFISSFITIIGFIVTYFLTRRGLKDELDKTKSNKSIELMQEIPYKLMTFLDNASTNNVEAGLNSFKLIISTVCAYGSIQSVKILTNYQATIYAQNFKDSKILFAYLGLLISQIKYDITGEIMSPTTWLIVKINDYSKVQKEIEQMVNELIDKLDLDKRFKVTEK